jgi:EAL domain-containing protein (putative c-di-GMP-specific phosphodiesterase class I)
MASISPGDAMHFVRQEILEPADGSAGYLRDRSVVYARRGAGSAAAAAIYAGRAALEYQPVYATGEEVNLAFYEARLILHDDFGRRIPRAAYAEAAVEGELGRDINTVALKMGLATLAARPDLRLKVPMSARALADSRWRYALEEGLAVSPYLGERLILEIDEPSAMALHDAVRRFMTEMQCQGVAFSLGCFGSGQTNFQTLRRFHFDLASLDPGFVREIGIEADNQVVVGALVSVAQQFDMFTVATGVSTPEEASCLMGLGVDCMTGRFFGPPLARL